MGIGTWITASAAGVAAVLSSGMAQAQAPKPTNILFIAIDDLRTITGAYGGVAKTPNLDKLAARGVIFDHAYVQQAVCAASRASLLTGTRPRTTTVDFPYNEFFTNTFLKDHPTLPTYFRSAGYYTVAFGKVHHGGPLDFQEMDETYNGADRDKVTPWWYQSYATPENRAIIEARRSGVKPVPKLPMFEDADVDDDAYIDGRTTTSAIKTLARASASGKPFFLAVGYSRPHTPYTVPRKYWDLYDPSTVRVPGPPYFDTPVPASVIGEGELPSYAVPDLDPDGRPPEAFARRMIHGYLAATSYLDAQVGRLLDELDRTGLAENTLVFLWSDHGYHLGERGHWGKRTLYELDTRSPLIVAGPRVAVGQRAGGIVEFVDFFPTLCEYAGLPKPGYLEGESFLPILQDPARPGKPAALTRAPRPDGTMGQGVRTHDYLYTQWIDPKGRITGRELYNAAADPAQRRNLADDPAYQDVCNRLAKLAGT